MLPFLQGGVLKLKYEMSPGEIPLPTKPIPEASLEFYIFYTVSGEGVILKLPFGSLS
jgi:hypothetical protein